MRITKNCFRGSRFFFLCLIGFSLFCPKSKAVIFNESGVSSAALGNTCGAFSVQSDVLFCNSTWIAARDEASKNNFKSNFYFGNDVSNIPESMRLASGNATSSDVKTLFSNHQNTYLNSNVEIGYLASTWGASIVPMRVSYFSQFNNEALPELSFYAAQEKEARFQFASYFQNDLFWGAQLKYLNRKFASNQFFITDALAENGSSLLESKSQDLLFFEPSVGFVPEGSSPLPNVNATIENIGWISKNYSEHTYRPRLNVNTSYNVLKNRNQILSVGLNGVFDSAMKESANPFGLGAVYKFGALQLMGSVFETRSATGFLVQYKNIETGLVYVSQQVDSGVFKNLKVQNIFMTLGAQL